MINNNIKSLRSFIGAKDFELSRSFYRDWGFEEHIIDSKMSYFKMNNMGFYLQDYYVKQWINNLMIFMEISDVEGYWKDLQSLELPKKYPKVRLVPIKKYDWGQECFVHDPSGVLWHIGEFIGNQ